MLKSNCLKLRGDRTSIRQPIMRVENSLIFDRKNILNFLSSSEVVLLVEANPVTSKKCQKFTKLVVWVTFTSNFY